MPKACQSDPVLGYTLISITLKNHLHLAVRYQEINPQIADYKLPYKYEHVIILIKITMCVRLFIYLFPLNSVQTLHIYGNDYIVDSCRRLDYDIFYPHLIIVF